MGLPAEKIIAEALQLLTQLRAVAAERLIENLDLDESGDVSPEWREEIIRRCREIDEGLVELVPAETMARKPRIHFPVAVYHVILRGNAGQPVFFDDRDRYRFYHLFLQYAVEKFACRVQREKGSREGVRLDFLPDPKGFPF